VEDRQIIELYWARSDNAIEETQCKYGKLCYKIAYNILSNRQDSEECVNDTYLRAWNTIPPNRPEKLSAFLCRITRNQALKKYESNEFIFSFICTLLRDIETEENENKNMLVQKAIDLMEQEFKNLDGIQNVANRLGISQEHFGRLFKAEMNVPPGQYLIKLRIQCAMQELLNTDDSLEKIAEKCGFSNANYLGKVFKKHVGTTPMQYRNMK
jgi:YesN/AraC family two-component response regulator